MTDMCHDCDIGNLSVLHIGQKGYKLDSLEIATAGKNGKTSLNEQLEFNVSPLLT